MRVLKTFFVLMSLFVLAAPAYAGDAAVPDDFEKRLELARQMQDIRPARDQVNSAIDRYVMRMEPGQREKYRTALQSILNYKALKKISVDAYAEVYTEEELRAMVDYFSKPEARSASEKTGDYAQIVLPEIIRMLDKAMMRVKTGGAGP